MALTLLSKGDGIQFLNRGLPGRDAPVDPSRPGDAPSMFTRSIAGGEPEVLEPFGHNSTAVDDDGQVIRLTGEDRVVTRFFTAIQPSRLYQVRYTARRRSNSPDPDNDAIRFGVLWFDQARNPLTGANRQTVAEDMLGVTAGQGRLEVSALLARAGVYQDSIIPPTGARYAKPFIQTYGSSHRTDVEVLSISDVTDVNLFAPDVSAFDGRVSALESLSLGDRVTELEQSASQPVTKRYLVLADAIADQIPAHIDVVETLGRVTAGDVGRALYRRSTNTQSDFQSADGALWVEVDEKDTDSILASRFGALPSLPDNRAQLQAAFDAAKDGGQEVRLAQGQFAVAAPLVLDYAGQGGESVNANGLWGVNVRGKGQRATNLLSATAMEYALRVLGGTGTAAHFYTVLSDFSIGPVSNQQAQGLHLRNMAFGKVENIAIQGLRVGMRIESVLSSHFEGMVFANCEYGTEALKGTGFSDLNANLWTKCIWRLNSKVGYAGGPHSNMPLVGCNVEGNGTHGDLDTGGMDLTFDGAEGAVGLVCNSGYIEHNRGGWDFNLTNLGSREIVHTFIGVNFNRVGTQAVINHIRATNPNGGRTRLVFIGCTFQHLEGYVPSAARMMVNADANTTIECYGCSIPNTVDATNLRNVADRIIGHIPATGSPSDLPAGWTLERPAEGVALVRHNLNLDPNRYHVNVTCTSEIGRRLQRVTYDPNYFAPVTEGLDGTPGNAPVSFELVMRR